jgi:hypothetical protein
MGDRAQVRIEQYEGEPDVVLYSHWGGVAFQEAAIEALDTPNVQERVGDPSYLTQRIIAEIIDEISGIGTGLTDNTIGRPIVVINGMTGEVRREKE